MREFSSDLYNTVTSWNAHNAGQSSVIHTLRSWRTTRNRHRLTLRTSELRGDLYPKLQLLHWGATRLSLRWEAAMATKRFDQMITSLISKLPLQFKRRNPGLTPTNFLYSRNSASISPNMSNRWMLSPFHQNHILYCSSPHFPRNWDPTRTRPQESLWWDDKKDFAESYNALELRCSCNWWEGRVALREKQ